MKAWRVVWSQTCRVMTDEVLQAAMAGIPKIAEAIAAIPAENRARAFDAAERRYLQTALDIGKLLKNMREVKIAEELEECRSGNWNRVDVDKTRACEALAKGRG